MGGLSAIKKTGRARLGPLVADRQPRRVDLPMGQWGLSVDGDGVAADGVDLTSLTSEFGSPLHIVQAFALEENIDEAMAPVRAGSGADVFYSYKTNPVPAVLECMHKGGIGAEVISAYEYWLARELGVPGERIIYNGPAKSPESIADAIQADTYLINANSVSDYEEIEAQSKKLGKQANLGVRAALPGMWAGQFGIHSGSAAVVDTIRRAEQSKHVNLKALHFHRGVTMRHLSDFVSHVESVLQYVDQIRAETGWTPEVIDLGGSLACPTSASIPTTQYRLNRALATDTLPPDPADCVRVGAAAAKAHRLVQGHFGALGLTPPNVVLEPGRALTANTQMLLTTVLDVKRDAPITHVVIDAGMNIAESVTNEYHQLFGLSTIGESAEDSYRIVGPICTPADVLYNNWRMPEPKVGHVLAIMDTGAYCVPFSTSFSFPRPAIVVLDDGAATVIRRAETFDDIVSLDQPLVTNAADQE